jgi:hypothetical protein
MAQPKDDDGLFGMRRTFEQDGVEVVRHFLSSEMYGDAESAAAQMWLGEKERERNALDEEQRALARHATQAALRANWIATAALIIAVAAFVAQLVM